MTQVADATGLSKPTAFRLLASLRHRSLVIKDEATNLYMLGPGWLRMLDGAATAFQSVAMLGRRAMEELTERTGETSVVHHRLGRERVCVAQVASSNPVRYTISVGAVAPLHIGSSGSVLLAFGSEDEQRLVDGTAVDGAELARHLERVRADGYAVSIGELTPGAAGVSVPVRGADGFLVALSVIGPAERFGAEHVEACLPELRAAAAALENALRRASSARV